MGDLAQAAFFFFLTVHTASAAPVLSPLFISPSVQSHPMHFPIVILKYFGRIHMPIKVWPGSCHFTTLTCLYTLQPYNNRNLTHCK